MHKEVIYEDGAIYIQKNKRKYSCGEGLYHMLVVQGHSVVGFQSDHLDQITELRDALTEFITTAKKEYERECR